jgi:glycosyltransferase involved in cell wall biosynthesis
MSRPLLPLVSIVVITYNSEKYIIETLESARNQSYENIELIITDDCSKDDTLKIAEGWLEKNSSRFKRTLIVPALINGGTSKNMNKGLNEAFGIWIKPIAGDDLLLPNCIESNVFYGEKNDSSINYISKPRIN